MKKHTLNKQSITQLVNQIDLNVFSILEFQDNLITFDEMIERFIKVKQVLEAICNEEKTVRLDASTIRCSCRLFMFTYKDATIPKIKTLLKIGINIGFATTNRLVECIIAAKPMFFQARENAPAGKQQLKTHSGLTTEAEPWDINIIW